MTLNLRKITILIFVLFSAIMLNAQEKGINLTKRENGKTVFLKENRRVLIKTDSGKILKGRFKIVDNNSIVIKKDTIALTSMASIKRKPFGLAAASGVLVLGVATPIVVASAAAGGYAVLLIPAGAAIGGIGLALPTLPKKYKKEDWDYTIVAEK
ncbi:hypothetical protein NAT51_10790 [Flavobacterium amniphilum]|uniref:hypothetical protein n=1 Tax=Flavobacterium amniphilum TaxID=1834035 RepID=UPI002029DC48|nr:hypothetical protein [Flavobacterium amniphilum]MCL9806013.1 hypothetical protein [Flavobacterium amniphilum]